MSEDSLPESDEGVKKVVSALSELREFFDSVQIVATRYDNDGEGFTDTISRGSGNWSARYGSIRETMLKMEDSIKIRRE